MAGKSSTAKVKLNSVFQYLDKCSAQEYVGPWLEAAVLIVLFHSNREVTFQNLVINELSSLCHAVARFALRTGYFYSLFLFTTDLFSLSFTN